MEPAPTNGDVAAVFQGIADLMEAKGENQFKIRAYRNAVRTLEGLDEPVSEIARRGELRQVPGFGEAISGKIGEILLAGTCDLYERLKSEQNATISEPITILDEQAREDAPAAILDDDIPSPW